MQGALILQGFLASESRSSEDSSLSQQIIKRKRKSWGTTEGNKDKGKRKERRRGVHVCYDLFDDYRDGRGCGDRWRRGVVMLSVTLGCVIQAGWMPLSTASCLNEEAYGCMRTSAHFMNIWFIFPVCVCVRERKKTERKGGRIFFLSFTCHCKNSQGLLCGILIIIANPEYKSLSAKHIEWNWNDKTKLI